jgi:hypothetical protein
MSHFILNLATAANPFLVGGVIFVVTLFVLMVFLSFNKAI